MPVSLEALGIDRLSVGERLELIEQIWDSLPEQVAPEEVPEWHRAELAKRRALAQAQPGVGKPWREVLGPTEEDDLVSELLKSNPSFRALVAKSKGSPRKPFPFSPGASPGAVPEPQK